MKQNDLTNRQLLEALTAQFDERFDSLEDRFDGLEQMLIGVKSVVVGIADTMATSEELIELKGNIHADFESLELRLGRRIDATLSMKTAKTPH